MSRKNRDGYVFYEDQYYLRKVGTNQFFIYSPELDKRDDMIRYNPFATNKVQEIKKAPGEDDEEHHSNMTKAFSGLTREEIREAVKDLNRPQRILWAIDLLFQKLPIHDLSGFNPSRVDILRIIGPPVSGSDLIQSLEKYKLNPTSIKSMIAEAAIDSTPDTEFSFTLIKEIEPDDPITTTDADIK